MKRKSIIIILGITIASITITTAVMVSKYHKAESINDGSWIYSEDIKDNQDSSIQSSESSEVEETSVEQSTVVDQSKEPSINELIYESDAYKQFMLSEYYADDYAVTMRDSGDEVLFYGSNGSYYLDGHYNITNNECTVYILSIDDIVNDTGNILATYSNATVLPEVNYDSMSIGDLSKKESSRLPQEALDSAIYQEYKNSEYYIPEQELTIVQNRDSYEISAETNLYYIKGQYDPDYDWLIWILDITDMDNEIATFGN